MNIELFIFNLVKFLYNLAQVEKLKQRFAQIQEKNW